MTIALPPLPSLSGGSSSLNSASSIRSLGRRSSIELLRSTGNSVENLTEVDIQNVMRRLSIEGRNTFQSGVDNAMMYEDPILSDFMNEFVQE